MAVHPGLLLHQHTLPGGTRRCSLPVPPARSPQPRCSGPNTGWGLPGGPTGAQPKVGDSGLQLSRWAEDLQT